MPIALLCLGDYLGILLVLMQALMIIGVTRENVFVFRIRIAYGAYDLEDAVDGEEDAESDLEGALLEAFEEVGPDDPITKDEQVGEAFAHFTHFAEEEVEGEEDDKRIDEHNVCWSNCLDFVPIVEDDQTCAQTFERTDGDVETERCHVLVLEIGLDHNSQFASDKLCNDCGSHRKDRHPKEDDEVANDE